MKNPYVFDIVVADEWGTATSPTTYCRHSGVGLADSLAEAAHRLEENWGNELISIKHLELLDGEDAIFLPWDILNNVINDEYWQGIPCDGMGEKI